MLESLGIDPAALRHEGGLVVCGIIFGIVLDRAFLRFFGKPKAIELVVDERPKENLGAGGGAAAP